MGKGKGRLLIRGEHSVDELGLESFVVRVPDGYRPTHVAVMPIEDQPIGDTEVLGWAYTTDTLPAVVDGSYYNAVFIRYRNINAGQRGVFYQVFYEPVDGSDLANAESV
jgi:hypothetical protein